MAETKRVTIYLSDAQKQALQALAEREGRSMSSQAKVSIMNDVRRSDVRTAIPSDKA